MLVPKTGLSTSQAYTWTARQTFTAVPTGTAFGDASVIINPASSPANGLLLQLGVADATKFKVDEDGDVTATGNGLFTGALSARSNNFKMTSTGNYMELLYTNSSSGLVLYSAGTTPGRYRVTAGLGALGTITLGANLDQYDVTIDRNVDGNGSTWSEDGANLFLSRSISDVSAESGNYIKADSVFRVDGSGEIILNELVRLKEGSSGWLRVRNLADGAFVNVQASIMRATGGHRSSTYKSEQAIGAAFAIGGETRSTDDAAGALTITAASARTSATAQKVGGALNLIGGTGDGAGGQEDADGGNVVVTGGAAASDLANSDGGDVLVGGGANGSSGADGAVKIGDGATETNFVQVATDGTMTFEGTARKTKHIIITNADLGKGASGASEAIVDNYTAWEFGINDDAVVSWELPADWATGTDITIFLHWQINEAYALNNGEVQWQVDWSACPHDETEALDAPTHSGTLDGGDQNIPATTRYLTHTEVGTISGASLSDEDALGFTITRITPDTGAPGVNPAAEPGVIHFEIHYVCDRIGE